MDVKLSQQTIAYLENVLDTTASSEESREMIVPDSLPDISRIICADGTALLRSKEAEDGRVTVSGDIAVTAAYLPEGQQGLKKLRVDMDFSYTAAAPEVTSSSRIWAQATVETVEIRILNPRKILAHVGLNINIRCYNDGSVGSTSCDEDDSGIQYLTEEKSVFLPWAMEEKTFIVSDDITFPGSRMAGEIIGGTALLRQGELKTVGSKIIFKGDALMRIKYITASGELSEMSCTTGFSQIMELDDADQCRDFETALMLTGCYFEPVAGADGAISGVTAELHAVAQTVAYRDFSVKYIADAYHTKRQLTLQNSPIRLTSFLGTERREELFREKLECRGTVRDVVSLSTAAGNAVEDGGSLRIPVNVSAVYTTEEGGAASVSGRFEFTAPAGDGRCCGALMDDGSYGSPADGAIDLRIPVTLLFRKTEAVDITAVSGISWDESQETERTDAPSLMVRRTRDGDSVWNIAKSCGSTRELIMAANGLEDETIGTNMLLLVPRLRN